MTQKQMTMQEVWSKIVDEANEKAINSVRIIHKMEIGQVVRQGDIYVTRVADDHPRGKRLESHQLAIGNTQGSRHVAIDSCDVYEGTTLPSGFDSKTFLGPLFIVKERLALETPNVVHPEHAHYSFHPGTYQVTHQMDARTGERTKD